MSVGDHDSIELSTASSPSTKAVSKKFTVASKKLFSERIHEKMIGTVSCARFECRSRSCFHRLHHGKQEAV